MSDRVPDADKELAADISVFAGSIGPYLGAHPHETQDIFDHILNQVLDRVLRERWRHRREELRGRNGFERIIVLARNGIEVRKRIFHMSSGEAITGIDFLLTKSGRGESRYLAVQVKRNGTQDYFEFGDREIGQFRRFISTFGSGYYLFVDETGDRSVEFFVSLCELNVLLRAADLTPTGNARISNQNIRNIGREPDRVYDRFYECKIGRRYIDENLINKSLRYVDSTNRPIVEMANLGANR